MKYILGGYQEACIRILDTNDFAVERVSNYANTSYMYVDHEYVYSIVKINELAGLVKLDKLTLKVSCINVHESIPSCYVYKHNNYIFTCNYHLGTLNIYNDDLSIIKTIDFKDDSKIHCISYNNNYFYACDLANDCIYKLDSDFVIVGEIKLTDNCGPRHIVFDNGIMYIACELSNELIVLDDEIIVKTIKLTNDTNASIAAIKQDECNIYISVRGINVICVINKSSLLIERNLDTLGKDPRDFLVDNNYIVVVHQNSDDIIIYKDFALYKIIKDKRYIYIDKLF